MAELLTLPVHRWTPRRKAEVVKMVHSSIMTLPEALSTFGISLEEFWTWELAGDDFNRLKTTRTQEYREVRHG